MLVLWYSAAVSAAARQHIPWAGVCCWHSWLWGYGVCLL